MTTSNDPRGRGSELYIGRQTGLGVPAVSPDVTFTRRHFYGWAPSPQSKPQDDEVMGGGLHNSVDARPAAPDIERGAVRVDWPLDLVQIGWVLTEMFGAPTTTGTGPYTHTFTSAGATIPTSTVERKLGASAFDGAEGAVLRSLQFPLGADRGFTRITADYFVRQLLEQYSSSVAGTPTTPALGARVPRKVGTILREGSAMGSIITGSLNLGVVLGEDSYHGSGLVDDVQVESRTAALNLTARFKGAAARDLGKIPSGAFLPDPYDFAIGWELSATSKLTLTIRNVRFAKTGVDTSGPGRLDVPLTGRAEVDAADPMITAVLVNSQATYT